MCDTSDNRVKRLFNKYDKLGDGTIKEESFVDFYKNSARASPATVWENLKVYKISNNLEMLDE
jgi:hypothetical protein